MRGSGVMCIRKLHTPWSIYRKFTILDFLKLNPHCALLILQQALYNSHSKKNLPYLLNLCVKHSLSLFSFFCLITYCSKKMYKACVKKPFFCVSIS